MIGRLILPAFISICYVALVTSRSIRETRDVSDQLNAAVSARQIGGGITALGTLVQPLLFLMGFSSFLSMLPGMFHTVLNGVGTNLVSAFTQAASGSSGSARFKRSLEDKGRTLWMENPDLYRILEQALEKYDEL